MKKLILLLLSLLTLGFVHSVSATTTTTLPELQLKEVATKIRKKEDFYLFIGRTDNVEAQLALEQLTTQAPQANRPVYFLNLKGIDSRKYKAFSKKYSIRYHTYLARFANKQQAAVYPNDWKDSSELTAFLQQP